MTVTTASGSKIFINPTASVPVDLAAYKLLTGWVEIKEVQNLGEFGDQANDVTFASLSDGRIRHLKGARDAGVLPLVCGRDPLDAGQQAARLAQTTKFSYPFKIIAADAPDEDHTDSLFFFNALVQGARDAFGENDSIVTTTFNLGIVTEIFEEPSEVIP